LKGILITLIAPLTVFLHRSGKIRMPSMARADFDNLSPVKKMNFIRDGGKIDKEVKE
jgi:hypothetical protein